MLLKLLYDGYDFALWKIKSWTLVTFDTGFRFSFWFNTTVNKEHIKLYFYKYINKCVQINNHTKKGSPSVSNILMR